MNNELCITLALRQLKCQNSISLTLDNVYTNIESNTRIVLSYGYILEIISINSNSVTISLLNEGLLEPTNFNIPFNSCRSFDLPVYNGNYIVCIGFSTTLCQCPNVVR